jgi:DNA-binding NtrC family response regulator/predicted TIM-barrel enzyme
MNNQTIKLHSILQDARSGRFPLIFAIPGSGQIARYAMEGGAHFLMVLNAGLYRMAGISSLGSFMPFGNANDQTEHLLRNQIIPRAHKVPIVAGVMANDPVLPLTTFFRRLQELGVAGITNWPAVGLIDGTFREILECEGLTVEAEIEMLMEAKKSGFVTFGFALNENDAAAMADAGADALVLAIGWTHETLDIHEKSDRIQYAVVKINKMIEAVRDTGKDPIHIFYGGAITLPEETAELYKRTRVHGYGVGSALERIPISRLITNIVKQLRSIPRYTETPSAGEGFGELVGSSPIMLKLYHLIKQVAPYDVNVCIEGESGSGKELVALQLHHLSLRNTQPFITLNCGAIPDTLIESELFGHEKGSFTGAMTRRLGKFELADRGILFLDEVAELSPKAQVSLLRAIQQKEISRVGGEKAIPVDVRIIAATHQNLETLVDKGRFRADLYFRLNNITIKIPPLRDRLQDIPALVNRFLIELGPQFGKKVLGVTPDFINRLMKHSWPGNVRELKHVLSRAILLEDSPILEGEDFSPKPVFNLHESPQMFFLPPASSVNDNDTKKNLLINALKTTAGNKSKAANLLGISRKTLYARLKKVDHFSMR